MDFICCIFMAPALKGSPGFADDQLKGIYYTKDIKIQKESKFPNTPEFFLTRRILGKEKLNLRLYMQGFSSGQHPDGPTGASP